MWEESVIKVSIFCIMVQVYCCCFPTVKLQRVCFTMKAESVTKVNIFLHIGISVLLLFFNCRFATSSFHHVGGVCYQSKFFLYNGTSVLLFSNCKVATSTFHHVGGVCYQGKFFVYDCITILLLCLKCRVVMSSFHHVGGVCYQGKFFVYDSVTNLLFFIVM